MSHHINYIWLEAVCNEVDEERMGLYVTEFKLYLAAQTAGSPAATEPGRNREIRESRRE